MQGNFRAVCARDRVCTTVPDSFVLVLAKEVQARKQPSPLQEHQRVMDAPCCARTRVFLGEFSYAPQKVCRCRGGSPHCLLAHTSSCCGYESTHRLPSPSIAHTLQGHTQAHTHTSGIYTSTLDSITAYIHTCIPICRRCKNNRYSPR